MAQRTAPLGNRLNALASLAVLKYLIDNFVCRVGEARGFGGGGGRRGGDDAAKVDAGGGGEGDAEAGEGDVFGDLVVGGVDGGGEDADEGLGWGGRGDGDGGEGQVGLEGRCGAGVEPGAHGGGGGHFGGGVLGR